MRICFSIVALAFCGTVLAQDADLAGDARGSAEPSGAAAEQHIAAGSKALEAAQPGLALEEFYQASMLDYFNKDVYFLMGRAYDALGQRENAFLAWEFAKMTAPEEIRKYFPPPEPRTKLPEVDASNENLTKALKKSKTHLELIETLRELLVIYETRGDADNALKYLDAAIELEPDNLDHFLHKCEILTLKQRTEDGAAFCRKALERQPDNPTVLRELAAFLVELKRYDEALKHLEHANTLEPNNAATLRSTGLAMIGRREYDKALELLGKAAQLDASDLRAWGSMGFVYLTAKKDYKSAFDAYYKVYKLEPAYNDGEHIERRVVKCLQGLADALVEPHLRSKDLGKLEELLRHANPLVRYKAAFSLGRLKAERSVPALKQLLSDPLEDIRSVAQFALGTIGGPAAVKALEEGIADGNPFVRAWSIFGYTMTQRDAALEKVLAIADSKLPYERLAAYKSLAIMTCDRAGKELARRLSTEENERVRQIMRKMLEKKSE